MMPVLLFAAIALLLAAVVHAALSHVSLRGRGGRITFWRSWWAAWPRFVLSAGEIVRRWVATAGALSLLFVATTVAGRGSEQDVAEAIVAGMFLASAVLLPVGIAFSLGYFGRALVLAQDDHWPFPQAVLRMLVKVGVIDRREA
jgi:cellobiose-specific phosphotransferase system component IIC